MGTHTAPWCPWLERLGAALWEAAGCEVGALQGEPGGH